MNRVILINPAGWHHTVDYCFPNVGIAYLVSALHRHRCECRVIDLSSETISETEAIAIVKKYQPVVVGFSVKAATLKNTRILAKQIKAVLPKVPIILGGPHATLLGQKLIREPCFDIIFRGEGELLFPDICNRLSEKKSIEHFPGLVTKDNYGRQSSLICPLIPAADLNSLPPPMYEPFPEIVREGIRKAYPLVTSRGCVYGCTYCSVPKISGSHFRARSAKSIIEELIQVKNIYGIETFQVIDDLFNFDIQRCKQICQSLINAKLGVQWSCPNGLRADRVDEELAELMFKSGCQKVMLGIESVSPKVLSCVNKGETIDKIKIGIQIFRKAGISVGGFFIIGLPNDSFALHKQSVKFVKKMGMDRVFFGMFVPYPGTGLWSWAKKNARFLYDLEESCHYTGESIIPKPIIETDDFSAADRLRTYEMVHTRLKQFNLLIPRHMVGRQYQRRMMGLLWRYDRWGLLLYIPGKIFGKIKKILKQIFSQ